MQTVNPTSLTQVATVITMLSATLHRSVYDANMALLGIALELISLPRTKAAYKSAMKMSPQYFEKDNRLTGRGIATLITVRTMLSDAFTAEVNTIRYALVNESAVSQKLRDLPNRRTLTPTQEHLCDETITCLQVGAFRAAAVMGWNLVYDYLRTWIFADTKHKRDFNREIKKVKSGGAIAYPRGFTKYSDFYTASPIIGERKVLDVMKDAGLLTGTYDHLIHYLRERNQYAHASGLQPTAAQVNHYVDDLIDIITSPNFPVPKPKRKKAKT
jgi:hypothetical protein